MSNRIILAVLFLCLYASSSFAKKKDKENFSPGPQPPMFLENVGQLTDQEHKPLPQINFILKAGDMRVFIEAGTLHYQFSKIDSTFSNKDKGAGRKETGTGESPRIKTYTLDVKLIGANQQATFEATDKLDYHETYFMPQCPKGAITYAYRKVTYKNIYPGIDWVLYTNGTQVEYDFVVHQGADPANIKMKYDGAIDLKLIRGSLIAATPFGIITEKSPISYDAEKKQNIPSHFLLDGNIVKIKTAPHKGTMIIDPILMFATYYGGFYDEHINAIAWNNITSIKNYMIAVGTTNSYDPIMVTSSTVQTTHSGSYGDGTYDGFIVAYTPFGLKKWATFFGGTARDAFLSVACDKDGNVYAGGGTNSSGLSTIGRFAISGSTTASNQYADGLIVKLNNDGTTLHWSTYFGGNNTDQVNSMTVDANNNLYVTGQTKSDNGLATPGAYKTTNPASVNNAFVAKIDGTGSTVWSSYYSNILYTNNDEAIGYSILCDKNGYVYVAGNVVHTYFPPPPPAPPTKYNRLFVTKFSASGSLIKELVPLNIDEILPIHIAYDSIFFVDSAGKRSDGLIYLAGSHIMGLNPDLDTLWVNPNPYAITSMAVSPTHVLIGTGYIVRPGYTTSDAVIAEYTKGALESVLYIGGTGSEEAYTIAVNDNLNHSYIGGFTTSRTGLAYNNPIYTNQISKDYIGESSTSSTLYGDAFFAGFDNDGQINFDLSCPIKPIPPPGSCDPYEMPCQGTNPNYAFDAFNSATPSQNVFNSHTVFTLQLSDSSGSFENYVDIGTSKIIGNIRGHIPENAYPGTHYKLRIVADNPYLISSEHPIIIRDAPTPVLSTNSPVCQDDTLKASFTDTTKGNVAYAWYKQGASSFYPGLSLNFANATPADNGKYILQSTLGLCIVTDTIQMTVKPKPAVASITNNTPICAEQPLQITIHDTNTTAVVYSWTGPNGYVASAKDTTILNANTSMTGIYHLTYGLDGCLRYDSTNIVVNTKPGFDSVSTNAPICDNDTLQLFANSTQGSAAAYTWYGPAGFTSTDQNPEFKADLSATGYYNVFSKLGNCISDTDSVQVIVKPLPAKPRLSSNSPVKPGKDILLAMDSVTDATYSWTGPDDFTSTDQNAVVSYVTTDAGGVYIGTVTVNGCSTSNMIKVEIDARDANAYFTLLFPNPNKGTFTVKGILQKAGNIPLQVRDAAGQIVYSTTLQSDKKRLEREVTLPGSLANGTYFVRLLINGEQKSIPFTLGK